MPKLRSVEDIKDMVTNIDLKIDNLRKELSSDTNYYVHINSLISKKNLLLWVLGDDRILIIYPEKK